MQGSNASWPVGGATRQSGGNWVGRFEKPEDWNIWASMYSSNLELGQLITVGDAILKWTATGVKFVDAVFATQADLDSFCSKIGTPIATGSTAMVNGVQYTYGAAGWVILAQATKPRERAIGTGMRFWLLGSSSTANCSTKNADPRTTTATFQEFQNGYFFQACAANQLDWMLVYNSGEVSYTTAQIYAKMQTDISEVSGYDGIVLQMNANNISGGSLDLVNAELALALGLTKFIPIILIVPHMTDAGSQYPSLYNQFEDWCISQQTKYPGQVFVANHYAAFGRSAVAAGPYSLDGTHLNWRGARIAGLLGGWRSIALAIGGLIPGADASQFGIPVGDYNNAASLSSSNATPVKGSDGKYIITGTSASSDGYSSYTPIAVTAGKTYRVFLDIDPLAIDETRTVAANVTVIDGAKQIRVGMYAGTTSDPNCAPGNIAPRLSTPFKAINSTVSIRVGPGGGLSSCRVNRVCILQID